MLTEFIKNNKIKCIIILVVIILLLVVINKVSSKKENGADTSSSSVEENYMDDNMGYDESTNRTEELDETQTTEYPDIVYGV